LFSIVDLVLSDFELKNLGGKKGNLKMSKKIILTITVALVLALTTVAPADLPPYQGVLTSTTTTNWSGTGHFWGDTDYLGISQASYDTAGAICVGSYKANTYTAYELGMTLDMLGTQMKAQVTSIDPGSGAYIDYSQNRLGPDPVWYGASAPGGQLSESYIGVWNGSGEVAMTTMTGGFGTLSENNYGGIKCTLGGHYQANLVADVDPTTGYYEMERKIMASDGDNVQTDAYGGGHAYLEALSSNMSPSEAKINNHYSGFHTDTAGWGGFSLEGSGTNRVTKDLGFSTSGFTTWSPIDGSDATGFYKNGDGVTQGSAFLGIYANWGAGTPNTGFDISGTGMTAN